MRNLPRCLILLVLVLATCCLVTHGRRGGGGSRGGGSRGGSRGSSSRGSSSSSSRGTHIDRSRDRGRGSSESRPPSHPAPAPPAPPPPKPKPSAPEAPVRRPETSVNSRQPAENPNYQQPPPYAPRERPPPYSPSAPAAPQGVAPPAYPGGGVPGANYPRQPGFPQPPGGVAPPAYPGNAQSGNYPRQPGVNPAVVAPPPYPGNVQSGNYPRQPGGVAPPPLPGNVQSGNYPRQPGGVAPPPLPGNVQSGNYPRQPGGVAPSYPGSVQSGNYPRQPGAGGIPNANYPRQPNYPPQTLGSNVWHPQSGMPSPAYMNHGGIPTGANMYSKPLKQKGFLGSLMTMGKSKPHTNKYYGSHPSPYGMRGGGMRGGGMGGMATGMAVGGAAGLLAGSAAMYTILPYMAMRSSSSFFRPRLGFMPLFLPSPFHHHHSHGYGHGYGNTYYDVYNNDYVGRCNRPLTPDHGKVICNSTNKQVDCDVTCDEGYRFPDNTTSKMNKCWHVSGIWKPTKNFPACEPVCDETCLNGGKCASPGVCGCTSEYRGPHCEFHFLKCDIRKLADGTKIRWVCTHTKNGTSCRVRCKVPEEAAYTDESIYTCTPEGVWTPSSISRCPLKSDSAGKNVVPINPDLPEDNVTKVPAGDNVTEIPDGNKVTEGP